jgi:hypothetical protein
MRTLMFIATIVFAGMAWADNATTVVKVYSLDVQERIQTLELIDVTAEKQISEEAEALDNELQAILDDAEALEEETE